MMSGSPTGPLASRLINQRAAAPWITLHRRAPLISMEILYKQAGPPLGTTHGKAATDIHAELTPKTHIPRLHYKHGRIAY